MWCVPAHMNAHTTASGKKNPAALPALIPAIFTFGATPTIPMPFFAAAIVPAVWVPWPLSSSTPTGAGFGTPPTQETLFGEVDVRRQVGMRVVEPGVDVADDDGGAAPVDCPCLGRMDLVHVPLEAGQAVASGRRGSGDRRVRAVGAVRLVG